MKKKFTCLLMALLFCVSALAGCSLVTRVDAKYYNATVATISYSDGTEESISKRDLLVAYNSYGYNYVDSYGYTSEEAIRATIESLIQTRVMIKAVEDYYVDLGEDLLNDAEKTYLWEETYDAMLENLRSYYNDIKGISDDDKDEDEEEASDNIFSDYESEAVVQKTKNADGTYSYSIIRTNTSATTRSSTHVLKTAEGLVYDLDYQDEEGEYTFREIMYNKILSLTTSTDSGSKSWKSALSQYISQVRENYDYEDLGTDKECFLFEINRVYEIMRDNYLVQKYTELFDYEEYGDGSIASLSVYDILAYYSAMVRASYTDYVMGGDEPDVLNDISSTYYIPDGDNASSYFSVAYIKIEFSDEDAQTVADLLDETSELRSYYGAKVASEMLEELYQNLTVTVRDETTGEETSETKTAGQLYQMIKSALADDGNEVDELKKAEDFRKFLYLYNDDDTLKNADYNAVFGVSVDGEVLLNDTFTAYDEEYQDAISDAILELYNNGNAQVGDITEFVRTDDGVYLFFYAGKIENLFPVDINFDVSKDESNIEVLTSTRLNIFSSKTVFDAIYEVLYSDGFSTYESYSITALVAQTERTIYESEISDLF